MSRVVRYRFSWLTMIIETFFKRVVGQTDVEDALQRLDTLTKEENLMAAARTLEVTHHVDDNVKVVESFTRGIDQGAKDHLFHVFIDIIYGSLPNSDGETSGSVAPSYCCH